MVDNKDTKVQAFQQDNFGTEVAVIPGKVVSMAGFVA